jgi:ketosteroid isomerase-like protein
LALGAPRVAGRGRDGVPGTRRRPRDASRPLRGLHLYEAFNEIRIEISEIRDLGDRLVAIGRTRARGEASGADVETPIAFVAEFKNGKTISIRGYLDPKESLEAAGLRE